MLPITFGFLLHDAARLMRREFDRRAKSSGLTRAQWAADVPSEPFRKTCP